VTELFLDIVNMSISAGWLVLAVFVLRLALKKAPKWVSVMLWGVVAVRLICPLSIESALSLIPSRETIRPEIMTDWTPEISTGIAPLDQVVNPVISTSFAPEPSASANPLQILIPVAAHVWILGTAVMLLYTGISYFLLRRKLRTAVILRDRIFQCEAVQSPFVLGILKPRIYLPYRIDSQDMGHVIAHEQAHIRRKDHWWKPLGFLLLSVYWFHPLMWIAYILLCRDIELACDEKVIAELGNEQRADYTQALVACSVNRRMIAACPLAFGEVGVKARIKSVMNYRKPAFWLIATALVVCALVAVCFLTDPNPSREYSMQGNNVSSLDPTQIVEWISDTEDCEPGNVYMNTDNFSLMIDSDFHWVDSQAVRYFYGNANVTYSGQLRIFPKEEKYYLTEPSQWVEQKHACLLQHYLEALKHLPQTEIRQMAPADQYIILYREEGTSKNYDRVITYSANGAGKVNHELVHLEILPQYRDGEGFRGTGDEAVHIFYGTEDTSYDLTLEDVIRLSQKGYDLTWADFEDYNYMETGSGLYIRVYKIHDRFELWIGGGGPDIEPMYMYLSLRDDLNTRIDIRDGGVEEFIAAHSDRTSTAAMIPTDTELKGIHAGALLLPLNGKTYRYLLTQPDPKDCTQDRLLWSFTENTGMQSVSWKVCSLKEYPDLTSVLMVSATNGSWLCTYSPPGRCPDNALRDAIDAGYAVMQEGIATHGLDAWKTFYEQTQDGKPASVTVAKYYTLDPERCDHSYFETFKQDYPSLQIYQLHYDGEKYTLLHTDQNGTDSRTFEYLMKYDTTVPTTLSSQKPERRYAYVLTHDGTVTWEQLVRGLTSAQMSAYIDHFAVYTEKKQ